MVWTKVIVETTDVSERVETFIRNMFVKGGNQVFQLVDVLEWASDDDASDDVLKEIERLIEKHGDRAVVQRHEWNDD